MDTQLVIEEYDSFIALKRFREGGEFLELAAEAARNENDLAGELVITNELIGHYRKNPRIAVLGGTGRNSDRHNFYKYGYRIYAFRGL